MSKVRGFILVIISIVITIVEINYLIIQPLISESASFELTEPQYWAIVIPLLVIILLFTTISGWIGYSMIVTQDPVRVTYEDAYEEATEEIESTDR